MKQKSLLFSGLLLAGVFLAACQAPAEPAADDTMMMEEDTMMQDESIMMEGTEDGMMEEEYMMEDDAMMEEDTMMEDDAMMEDAQ